MQRNATGYLVPDLKKFPKGIDGLADDVHKMGLKLGIYSDAGDKTCAGYPGSLGKEKEDAKLWASWGIDCTEHRISKWVADCDSQI
jgi:alpha-galactosidase